jgi:hypothetical protein
LTPAGCWLARDLDHLKANGFLSLLGELLAIACGGTMPSAG